MEPAEVVRAHIASVAAGDERGALALLTPEGRARAPPLPGTDGTPEGGSVAEVERSATWAGARELAVVRTVDGWRIRRGVLALFSAESAESALLALGRAIEAKDFQRVVGLIPSESSATSAAGLAGHMAGHPAWSALAQAIVAGKVGWVVRERTRAEAVVAVAGAEHRVVMVQEQDGWKVFDVLPRSSYLDRR
jgi:hypothetical protein